MFTRTKHGAKKLAKQLISLGVPAVDLHGNLSQNARTRNLDAFHSGRVSTLVATDIAARGIHVDDVALVVHADPPVEHKAYLHRSGRTARAGAEGTVVTLELPSQRSDVQSLLRQAKIRPTFTNAAPGAGILTSIAPGERTFLSSAEAAELAGATPKQPQQRKAGQGASKPRGTQQGSDRQPGSGRSTTRSSSRRRSGGAGQQTQRAGAAAAPARSAADFSKGYRRGR